MASRLTPIGWIAKFLVVPVALGALGFYVIGPKIGLVRPAPRLPVPLPTSLTGTPEKPATGEGAVQDAPPQGLASTLKPEGSAPDSASRTAAGGPNLGEDTDSASSSTPVTDDTPKPRVRRSGRPPSMVAPPTDPAPGEDGSGSGH